MGGRGTGSRAIEDHASGLRAGHSTGDRGAAPQGAANGPQPIERPYALAINAWRIGLIDRNFWECDHGHDIGCGLPT